MLLFVQKQSLLVPFQRMISIAYFKSFLKCSHHFLRIAAALGAVIGGHDGNSSVSLVNPMPGPENNLLYVLQSYIEGKRTDIGLNTLMRTGGKFLLPIPTDQNHKLIGPSGTISHHWYKE